MSRDEKIKYSRERLIALHDEINAERRILEGLEIETDNKEQRKDAVGRSS